MTEEAKTEEIIDNTPDLGAEEVTPEVVEAAPENAEEVIEEWKPFEKVKVMEEDHDVPEWLKPAINKDNEAEVKRFLEKAYGIDYQTPKYESAKAELGDLKASHQEMTGKYEELVGDIQYAYKLRDQGDLAGLFELLDVKPESVYQWVVQSHKMAQMPAHEREALMNDRKIVREHLATQDKTTKLEEELNGIKSRMQAEENTKALVNEIQNNPEINQIASFVDEKKGQSGTFIKEVVQLGTALEQQGKSLSFGEVAEMVANQYKGFIGEVGSTQNHPPHQSETATPQSQANPVTQKPTIPNIGSSETVTPVKRRFKSVDELRKFADSQAIGG